jgi:hypothetical protein
VFCSFYKYNVKNVCTTPALSSPVFKICQKVMMHIIFNPGKLILLMFLTPFQYLATIGILLPEPNAFDDTLRTGGV